MSQADSHFSDDRCAFAPCLNGGTCTADEPNDSFHCICAANFTGEFCASFVSGK